MIKHILGVSFTFLVSGLVILFPFIHSSQDELSAVEAVEKINRKIQSTPEMENWQATVLSTIHEMDKSWQPKKKIVIEKLVVVEDKKRTEKILGATEFHKDGKRDITAKLQAEAAKYNRRSESGKDKERRGKGHRGLDLSRDELFPFGEERRTDYEFEFREAPLEGQQKTYILETRSKKKSPDFFEGIYHIHPDTNDVIRADLRPAKKPVPLRQLEMRIDFTRLPEGQLVISRAKVRIHVGLIVKNIRMDSEDIFSDYKIYE